MGITLNEGVHTAEHLVSEANGTRSREAITVLSGQNLKRGAVLGRITLGAAVSAVKASGPNTGNGTVSAVTRLPGARVGVYTVRFTAATAFTVEDPNGDVIGNGVTGTAFADDLQFTITAGGTAFVAGDGFDITVADGSGKYTALNTAATDGSHIAAGVLYADVDATAGDQRGVAHVRDTEVNGSMLVWPVGITTQNRNAALAALAAIGIIAR